MNKGEIGFCQKAQQYSRNFHKKDTFEASFFIAILLFLK